MTVNSLPEHCGRHPPIGTGCRSIGRSGTPPIWAFRGRGTGPIWQTCPVIFRLARRAEAPLLSDLALRSKRHWGYDDDFMNRCRRQLMVDPDQIARGRVER
jgi:hypothetical protein